MPHLIVEYSNNIKDSAIDNLFIKIQEVMQGMTEGNFDFDQCKCRKIGFDDYLVGKFASEESAFIHVTIKILAGRSVEVKKQLAEKSMQALKAIYNNLATSPSAKDHLIETAQELGDAISGVPHVAMPMQNSDLAEKRCDLSVDIVDMERETYQKVRIGK